MFAPWVKHIDGAGVQEGEQKEKLLLVIVYASQKISFWDVDQKQQPMLFDCVISDFYVFWSGNSFSTVVMFKSTVMELPLAAITSCLSYSKLVFRKMRYWFQAKREPFIILLQ